MKKILLLTALLIVGLVLAVTIEAHLEQSKSEEKKELQVEEAAEEEEEEEEENASQEADVQKLNALHDSLDFGKLSRNINKEFSKQMRLQKEKAEFANSLSDKVKDTAKEAMEKQVRGHSVMEKKNPRGPSNSMPESKRMDEFEIEADELGLEPDLRKVYIDNARNMAKLRYKVMVKGQGIKEVDLKDLATIVTTNPSEDVKLLIEDQFFGIREALTTDELARIMFYQNRIMENMRTEDRESIEKFDAKMADAEKSKPHAVALIDTAEKVWNIIIKAGQATGSLTSVSQDRNKSISGNIHYLTLLCKDDDGNDRLYEAEITVSKNYYVMVSRAWLLDGTRRLRELDFSSLKNDEKVIVGVYRDTTWRLHHYIIASGSVLLSVGLYILARTRRSRIRSEEIKPDSIKDIFLPGVDATEDPQSAADSSVSSNRSSSKETKTSSPSNLSLKKKRDKKTD